MYRRQNIVLFLLFVASLAFLSLFFWAVLLLGFTPVGNGFTERNLTIFIRKYRCVVGQNNPFQFWFRTMYVCMVYSTILHTMRHQVFLSKTQFCKHTLVQGTWFTFLKKIYCIQHICSALFCNFSCILRKARQIQRTEIRPCNKYLLTIIC